MEQYPYPKPDMVDATSDTIKKMFLIPLTLLVLPFKVASLLWLLIVWPVQLMIEVAVSPMVFVVDKVLQLIGIHSNSLLFLFFPFMILATFAMDDAMFCFVTMPCLIGITLLIKQGDCHEQSHIWYGQGEIKACFVLMSQMMITPITQHVPHIYLHHKVNMKSPNDPDYLFDYDRCKIVHFLHFWCQWDVMTNLGVHTVPTLRRLDHQAGALKKYLLTWFLHVGMLVTVLWLSPVKFLALYCIIFRANFELALLTWTFEHPFLHKLDGSFEHNWNTCVMVSKKNQDNPSKIAALNLMDNHAFHHAFPGKSYDDGVAHFENRESFVQSQLENRYLLLNVDTYQLNPLLNWLQGKKRTMNHMAYAMFKRDYEAVYNFVVFQMCSEKEKNSKEYNMFADSVTVKEIQARLSPKHAMTNAK